MVKNNYNAEQTKQGYDLIGIQFIMKHQVQKWKKIG